MTTSHIVIDEFTIEMQAECSAIIVAYKGKSEHLTIPSSLDCDGQSIQIAGIKESAFEGNPNLKSVSFAADSKIDAIPPRLLQGCAALMEVHLPSSVSSLGDYCFADCPALRYIIIDGKEGTLAFGNDIVKGSDPFLLIESGLRLEEENRYYWGGYDRLITGYQGIKGITDDGLEYALCHDFDGADRLLSQRRQKANGQQQVPK